MSQWVIMKPQRWMKSFVCVSEFCKNVWWIPWRMPFHIQPSGRRIWVYSCCRGRRDKNAVRVAGNTGPLGRARCGSAPVRAGSSGGGSRRFFQCYRKWRCVCHAGLGVCPRVTVPGYNSSRHKTYTARSLVSCYKSQLRWEFSLVVVKDKRIGNYDWLPRLYTPKSGRNHVQFESFPAWWEIRSCREQCISKRVVQIEETWVAKLYFWDLMLSSVNPDSCISAMGNDKSMDEALHCKWLLTEMGDWQTDTSSEWSSSSSVLLHVLVTPLLNQSIISIRNFLLWEIFNQAVLTYPSYCHPKHRRRAMWSPCRTSTVSGSWPTSSASSSWSTMKNSWRVTCRSCRTLSRAAEVAGSRSKPNLVVAVVVWPARRGWNSS